MSKRMMVVRTYDDDKEWIWKGIKNGRLQQGWGIPGTRLTIDGEMVQVNDWIVNYQRSSIIHWEVEVQKEEAEKRYWILYPMTELKQGDIIVVPKMPDWKSFSILVVSEGYNFDDNLKQDRDDVDDFRHYVSIDKEKLKVFNYYSCEEARTISKKFRAYQSAVNNVWNQPFIDAVSSLKLKESDIGSKDVPTIFNEMKADLISPLIKRVQQNLHWRDLEDLVVKLFEVNGYVIEHRNRYDGKGGDADIIATYKLPILSDHTDTDLKVYIQVKHKEGDDWDDSKGVEQLHQISKLEPNVKKILISTTDKFSHPTKMLASEHDVILINGSKIIEMMAKYL